MGLVAKSSCKKISSIEDLDGLAVVVDESISRVIVLYNSYTNEHPNFRFRIDSSKKLALEFEKTVIKIRT